MLQTPGEALVKVARDCLSAAGSKQDDGRARRAREEAQNLLEEGLNRFPGSPTKFSTVGAGGWDARMSGRVHGGEQVMIAPPP